MSTRTPAQVAGGTAEQQAADFLQRRGYAILERNYKCRLGEIDLVASDRDSLVFVEVRMRNGAAFGSALESITPHKKKRIIAAAKYYLMELGREPYCRFDVIAIDEGGPPEWHQGAFDTNR